MIKTKILLAALVASWTSLASASEPVHLVCPTKNHKGESGYTQELWLDESTKTVALGPKFKLPADYSSASVVWYVKNPDNPEIVYTFNLDRYSGELTISFVNPPTGSRLVTHSGTCSVADDSARKF